MRILQKGASELGINLTSGQLEQFEAYYRELIDWNERINLTGITDYEEAQAKHFLDSLTVIETLEGVPDSLRVIDVGSGAGLPGLPLKIVFPCLKLTLLEATAKKTGFLKHVVERLALDGIDILTGRAEEAAHQPEYRERFDAVLSRAVAELPALAELTLPFCAVSGRVIAWKKGDIGQELEQAGKAIETLGGKLREIIELHLDGLDDDRKLVVLDKTAVTPPKYPRRPGIPAKRPIK